MVFNGSFCRGRRFLICDVSKQFKSPQPALSGVIPFASIHHELKAASLRIRESARTAFKNDYTLKPLISFSMLPQT